MAITAGQRVLSTSLSQPFASSASSSADLTQTTTTPADITGATVTFNTTVTNVTAVVMGIFDISTSSANAAGTALGLCVVDGGAAQSMQATWQLGAASTRATVSQVWNVTLAAAGSHTIKLRGNLSAAAGTAVFNHPHTGITVLVFDF